ncbi:hypothetical protein AMTRI_Chr10g233190 [Amborella trichopoda]
MPCSAQPPDIGNGLKACQRISFGIVAFVFREGGQNLLCAFDLETENQVHIPLPLKVMKRLNLLEWDGRVGLANHCEDRKLDIWGLIEKSKGWETIMSMTISKRCQTVLVPHCRSLFVAEVDYGYKGEVELYVYEKGRMRSTANWTPRIGTDYDYYCIDKIHPHPFTPTLNYWGR